MKVLIDCSAWPGARAALEAAGHAVERAHDWAFDPGDRAILAHAYEHNQVLITADADFGELAVRDRQPHAGIIRLDEIAADEQGLRAGQALDAYGPLLTLGAIVTVDNNRMRLRLPEPE